MGLCRDEQLTNEALIREQYRGIRPAPGYPACPDHSLKPILFDMLGRASADRRDPDRELRDAADLGGLAASISAIAHGQYFGVARIGRDQVEDYAARRGVDLRTGGALAAAQSGLSRRAPRKA